jgi:GNAT superfamily N-acetyltransferase
LDDLIIRPATESDLGLLQHLYRHLNPGDPALDVEEARVILDRLSRYTGSAVLLGICDETIATTCTLVVIPNLTRGGAPYALVENVITDPRYRKRGFGKAILTEALSVAWRHGCYKVMLLTGSKTPATLRFYSDVGFEQSKTGFQVRRVPARKE